MTSILKLSVHLFLAAIALVRHIYAGTAAAGREFRRRLERSDCDEQRALRPILSLRSVHS